MGTLKGYCTKAPWATAHVRLTVGNELPFLELHPRELLIIVRKVHGTTFFSRFVSSHAWTPQGTRFFPLDPHAADVIAGITAPLIFPIRIASRTVTLPRTRLSSQWPTPLISPTSLTERRFMQISSPTLLPTRHALDSIAKRIQLRSVSGFTEFVFSLIPFRRGRDPRGACGRAFVIVDAGLAIVPDYPFLSARQVTFLLRYWEVSRHFGERDRENLSAPQTLPSAHCLLPTWRPSWARGPTPVPYGYCVQYTGYEADHVRPESCLKLSNLYPVCWITCRQGSQYEYDSCGEGTQLIASSPPGCSLIV